MRRKANAEEKLNKRLLRQMLRGYRMMNKITATEERAWAARLTPKAARAVFEDLYRTWERMGARAGGDWEALERRRIAETIQAQRPFVRLARRMRRR
ncbi:MAG: hypothetical protein FJ009_10535 [Chloroflexi bacterium]|nr:hypothetical protein [Chloroflexota bacterium]